MNEGSASEPSWKPKLNALKFPEIRIFLLFFYLFPRVINRNYYYYYKSQIYHTTVMYKCTQPSTNTGFMDPSAQSEVTKSSLTNNKNGLNLNRSFPFHLPLHPSTLRIITTTISKLRRCHSTEK